MNGHVAVAESSVIASIAGVPAHQFVEIRAIAPAAVFTAPSTGSPRLADILADEARIRDTPVDPKPDRRTAGILTALLGAIGLAGTGALWYAGGREPKSTEVLGEYWREPLDDKPAIAAATIGRGSVKPGVVIAGTLVDMAQRGYLKITGETQTRIGPDKVVHRFDLTDKPFAADVAPWEAELIEMVFRGQSSTTSDELTAWAKGHPSAAQTALRGVTKGVAADFKRAGYETSPQPRMVAALAAVCLAVAGGGWLISSHYRTSIGFIAVAVAVVAFVVGIRVLRNRSTAGAEAAAKAAGLRNYIRDFSQLADAPVGHLILWERYLVYAVAFGVSAQLVKGLAAKLPQVLADPNFGTWYIGPNGRLDGFSGLELAGARTAQAATPQSSSGSSGGFSGGGSSGGGGGGGFGAR